MKKSMPKWIVISLTVLVTVITFVIVKMAALWYTGVLQGTGGIVSAKDIIGLRIAPYVISIIVLIYFFVNFSSYRYTPKKPKERTWTKSEVQTLFKRYNEFTAHHDPEEWDTWIEVNLNKSR